MAGPRRYSEALRGREEGTRLVVQLVCRVTRVESHCLQAGSPARARQWGRSCSRGPALPVSPHGMRGSTHAYQGRTKRSLGAWGYRVHTRARAERVEERTDATTAHACSVRSTALKR